MRLRWNRLYPQPGEPVADVWVMVFDPDGSGNRAVKHPHPIGAADYRSEPWSARVAGTGITLQSWTGSVNHNYGRPLPDAEICAELIVFVLAGHGTTATTLTSLATIVGRCEIGSLSDDFPPRRPVHRGGRRTGPGTGRQR